MLRSIEIALEGNADGSLFDFIFLYVFFLIRKSFRDDRLVVSLAFDCVSDAQTRWDRIDCESIDVGTVFHLLFFFWDSSADSLVRSPLIGLTVCNDGVLVVFLFLFFIAFSSLGSLGIDFLEMDFEDAIFIDRPGWRRKTKNELRSTGFVLDSISTDSMKVIEARLRGTLLSFTGFHWLLLAFIGFHGLLLGFTEFYWVFIGF